MSLGILVHGSNHFILRGPEPAIEEARQLVRRWEFPTAEELLRPAPADARWEIRTREFRENLEWAVVLASDNPPTPAVLELLRELEARGVMARHGAGLFEKKFRSEPAGST